MELTFNTKFIDQYWQMFDQDLFKQIKSIEKHEDWIVHNPKLSIQLMILKESAIHWDDKFFIAQYENILKLLACLPFSVFLYILKYLKNTTILFVYLLKSFDNLNFKNGIQLQCNFDNLSWEYKIFILRLHVVTQMKQLSMVATEENMIIIEPLVMNYIKALSN